MSSIDLSKIDGNLDAGTGDGGTGCPEHMVEAPGVGAFCIDAEEVTNQAYAAFFADSGPWIDRQPNRCRFNDSFVPAADWPFEQGREQHPIRNTDWCDARAYCAWAGGRLCTREEWLGACSNDGERIYPYGADYVATACNGEGRTETAPVGSFAECAGGYPGLFDMSGNVEEWIDECDNQQGNGPNDLCTVFGGSAGSGSAGLACTAAVADRRSQPGLARGFRCCR